MGDESRNQRRRYRKQQRAEQERQTRQRITEAAMRLHGSVGPARTSVKAVAEEAGVQRATVYAHFPDAKALFEACSGHYARLHPAPDPARWSEIADPGERLSLGLAELYAWYGETEQMRLNVLRDMDAIPAKIRARGLAFAGAAHAALMRRRPERGRARVRVSAAIGHATAFPTWHSLVRQQRLTDAEAITLMTALVAGAGGRSRPRSA